MIYFLLACSNYNALKQIKKEIIKTPYGHECIKISSGKNWSSIECWDIK